MHNRGDDFPFYPPSLLISDHPRQDGKDRPKLSWIWEICYRNYMTWSYNVMPKLAHKDQVQIILSCPGAKDLHMENSNISSYGFASYPRSHGFELPIWNDNYQAIDDLSVLATSAYNGYGTISEYAALRNEEEFWNSSNGMALFSGSNSKPFVDINSNSNKLQRNMGIEEKKELYNENSDEFRMYKFKVVICTRETTHDWTECPFAHRGERARRRDPSLYCGETCSDYKKGYCRKGLACEFAHGLFESWLHPHRYRTQRCKDGVNCTRRVCFFAHRNEELRLPSSPRASKFLRNVQCPSRSISCPHYRSKMPSLLSQAYLGFHDQDMSPRGASQMGLNPFYMNSPLQNSSYSPYSSLSSESLASSNLGSPSAIEEVVTAFRNFDLRDENCINTHCVTSNSIAQNHVSGDQYNSLQSPLPEREFNCGLQRVESGKRLRAEIYNKIWKQQLQDSCADQPDLGWVSELVEEQSKIDI